MDCRSEWYRAGNKAAIRSRLWTGDLLKALDELLSKALPANPLDGSGPSFQPLTPPLHVEGDHLFMTNLCSKLLLPH